jgi:hypothetical protein
METDKDDRRRRAQLLVGAILNWGGQGKDIAAFLGVSATTISHWHGAKSGGGRKPAIPTDEQIERLIGILRLRIQQNLNFLTTMMHMGGFDHQTSVLLARTLWREMEIRIDYFKRIDAAAGPDLDDLMQTLAVAQEKGGPAALRTLLKPLTKWGSELPDPNSIPDVNEPVDLEKIREHLTVGPVIDDRTERYAAEFHEATQQRILKKLGMSEMKKPAKKK